MNKELGFNGPDFEMGPVQPVGRNLDLGSRQIVDPIQEGGFGKDHKTEIGTVAENFSKRCGRVGAEVNDSKSITFQQNMVKELSKISENKKEVKDLWNTYEEDVRLYIEEANRDENKKKMDSEDIEEMRKYFNGLKRSVIGSLAVINFFEGQGFQVKFPSVEEDMEKKCDLKFVISNSNGKEVVLAVQVKSGHLERLSHEKLNEVVKKLILTDTEKLDEKGKKDLQTLSRYCSSLSKKNEVYIPVFVNIPVTQALRRDGLVNENGKIIEILQKFMENAWKEAKENLAVDLDKY